MLRSVTQCYAPLRTRQLADDHVTATSIAKAITAKAKHIERVAAIVESGNYAVVPFGGLPPYCTRLLWPVNGSMIAPDEIKHEPQENKFVLPDDMEKLVPDQKYDST